MADRGARFLQIDDIASVIDDYFPENFDPESDTESDDEVEVQEPDEFIQSAESDDDEGELRQLEEAQESRIRTELNSFVSADTDVETAIDHHQKCNCSCKRGVGATRCIVGFTNEQITTSRLAMAELDCHSGGNQGKEVAVLSLIQAGYHCSADTIKTKRGSQTTRVKARTDYRFMGKPVCTETVCYIHTIGMGKLKELVKHFSAVKAVVPRKLRRGSQKTISYEQSQNFAQFMKNYLEQYSLVLPGRLAGISRSATEVLPSHLTKQAVYGTYKTALPSDQTPLSEASFKRLWKLLYPTVAICKPMSDLCWTCQRNNAVIYQ